MKLKGNPWWEASQTIFWGLVLITIVFGFWLSQAGSLFSDYALMIKGVHVNGQVDSCIQDYDEGEMGNGAPFQDCTYSFNVNGRTFGGRGAFPQSTFAREVFGIIYLPENPETHKKEFTIPSGMRVFIVRKVIFVILLLIFFVVVGVKLGSAARTYHRNHLSSG